jgi:hypothetical protein
MRQWLCSRTPQAAVHVEMVEEKGEEEKEEEEETT